MKNLCLLILLLFMVQFSFAQDEQWYVIDNKNNVPDIIAAQDNYVINIKHPATFDPDIHQGTPRNDFFVIYESRDYFNSYYGVLGETDYSYVPYAPTLANPDPRRKYCLTSSAAYGKIQYLYVSNPYELPDFPPASIKVKGASGTGACPANFATLKIDPIYNVSAPLKPYGISISHDFVPGSDFTLIIDSSEINSEINSLCQMELCFNIKSDGNVFNVFSPEDIFKDVTGANKFVYPTATDVSYNISQNCILFNDPISENKFINFKVSDDPTVYGAHIDSEFEFVLRPATPVGQGCKVFTVKDFLRNSHDPNYSQLETICIDSEENVFLYYHIQSYNDEGVPALDLSFDDVVLPDGVDISNGINIIDWAVGISGNMSNSSSISIVNNPDGSVNFEFPLGLGLNYNEVAYVDFCVATTLTLEDVQSYDLDLSLGTPNSMFGNDEYPITSFIDEDCKRSTIGCQRDIIRGNNCCVQPEPPCPHGPFICWFLDWIHGTNGWIFGLLGLFLLAGVISRLRRKKTKG